MQQKNLVIQPKHHYG